MIQILVLNPLKTPACFRWLPTSMSSRWSRPRFSDSADALDSQHQGSITLEPATSCDHVVAVWGFRIWKSNKRRQERWLDLKSGRRQPIGRTLCVDLQISARGNNWLINRRAAAGPPGFNPHCAPALVIVRSHDSTICCPKLLAKWCFRCCHLWLPCVKFDAQAFFARSFQHIVYPWYNLLYGCTSCVLCPDDKDN